MPRLRFTRAAPEKQNAVLDAAAAEIAQHGYEAASVNRILQAAGFSKGAFYYYFEDKEDLIAALLERENRQWTEMFSRLRSPETADEFWEEMDAFTKEGMSQFREAPDRAQMLLRLGTAMVRHSKLLERVGALMKDSMIKLGALWARGQEVGAVRKDLPIGTLMALLQGIKLAAANVLLPVDRAPTMEELEAFSRVHLDMVRRVSAPAAPSRMDEPPAEVHP